MATQTRLKAGGLERLAARNPERWLWPNGSPRIVQIAKDAGLNRIQIYRVRKGECRPGLKFQDNLRDLLVSTGISHETAHEELFELVEVDEPKAAA